MVLGWQLNWHRWHRWHSWARIWPRSWCGTAANSLNVFLGDNFTASFCFLTRWSKWRILPGRRCNPDNSDEESTRLGLFRCNPGQEMVGKLHHRDPLRYIKSYQSFQYRVHGDDDWHRKHLQLCLKQYFEAFMEALISYFPSYYATPDILDYTVPCEMIGDLPRIDVVCSGYWCK